MLTSGAESLGGKGQLRNLSTIGAVFLIYTERGNWTLLR